VGKVNLKNMELYSNYSIMTKQYDYSMAIQDIKITGYVTLDNLQKLSCSDLHYLCEEMKHWYLYGNQDLTKLNLIQKINIAGILL